MAVTHTSTFRVRFDECDMYGHVNHATYLRYMLEAAFSAAAAVGYPRAWHQAHDRYWLTRDTDITYLAPLRHGETVAVKTWVMDFRRVRTRRAYELRRAGADELVARAHTDWVFLNTATQRPVTIPPEMVAAFLPDGPAADVPPRERFPQVPPPPPGIFSLRRRVQWSDVDPAGHVNNAVYISYLEDCAIQDAISRGWTMQRMIEGKGFAIVARRYRIEYRQQAYLDDELEVSTWIANVKRASAVRHYTITRASDGELLTRARALWVWVNPESGRPVRIPADFLADFADNIVP